MPMGKNDAVELVRLYMPRWQANRERMSRIDRWHEGSLNANDKPKLPTKSTNEFKQLRDRAITPWLKLVVTVIVQSLFVEGYRNAEKGENTPAWRAWQANRFDARQIAVNRGAVSLGLSFVSALPGRLEDGSAMPQWRGHSARSTLALYQDVAADEWPMYALTGQSIKGRDGSDHWRMRFYDDEAEYVIDVQADGDRPTFIELNMHNAGVCPFVRFTNQLDLEGRSSGEVEPYIDMVSRIDQDVLDRLVVQRFGAWVVRYIAGLAKPETDEEARAERLRLSIEDILIAEDTDTKFGSLPATPLDGYIKAKEADVHDLAAITQTPATDLLGNMINLSAEALAAAEAGKMRKVNERQHALGESYESLLRLSAHLMGDPAGASDFEAQIVWADTESRSLSMVADALGKMVTQLGIPPEGVWSRIPGVTQDDIKAWKSILERGGGDTEALMRELLAGAGAAGGDGGGGS